MHTHTHKSQATINFLAFMQLPRIECVTSFANAVAIDPSDDSLQDVATVLLSRESLCGVDLNMKSVRARTSWV